jgi:hypothetical protein
LSLPIELSYYNDMSGNTAPADATIDDVYNSLNKTGLYNSKIYQDIFLGYTNENYTNVWNTPEFAEYLRYITLNFGLNSMFITLTPRQFLGGFDDVLIAALRALPIYMGGD